MQLIERSVKSPDYHAGKEAADDLGSRIKDTIQESLKKESKLAAGDDSNDSSTVEPVEPAPTAAIESQSPVSKNIR